MALAVLLSLVQEATTSFCVIHVDGDEGSSQFGSTEGSGNQSLQGIKTLD